MLDYSIGSPLEREDLYVELYKDNAHWGNISITEDLKGMELLIHANTGIDLSFDYYEFIAVVTTAGQHLWGLESNKNDLPS